MTCRGKFNASATVSARPYTQPRQVVANGEITGIAQHSENDDSSLAVIEQNHVMEVLRKCGGNKARAARSLGIHRRKLYRLLERFARRNSPRRSCDSKADVGDLTPTE